MQTGSAWSPARGTCKLQYWKTYLCGCGHWERVQHLSVFVPYHNLLAVYIDYLGQSSQLKLQGLWIVWLRARIQISLKWPYLFTRNVEALFAHPSRNRAASSCAYSSEERYGWWQSFAKLGLPCFWGGAWCFLVSSFVQLFWSFSFFPEHTGLCRELLCPQMLCTLTLLVILHCDSHVCDFAQGL